VKRVLTAAVLIPVVLAVIFLAPNRIVRLALASVALLCLREFFHLADNYRAQPIRLAGYVAAAWIAAGAAAENWAGALLWPVWFPPPGLAFFLVFTLVLLGLAMSASRDLSTSLPGASATLLGVIYLGVPFRMAGDLHAITPHWLFYVLLMNWAGDTAAYYAGRSLGRHKLAPLVSPGKTVEGAVASLLVAAPLGAAYILHFMPGGASMAGALRLSFFVNIVAQLGDLAESALKRGANVKDSGELLPGHGGLLDRLDGVLFSIPVVWLAAGM